MRLFHYSINAIRHVHQNWVDSSASDKEVIAHFFKQFVGIGESISIRAIRTPTCRALSDAWNNLYADNQYAVWWKDKRGRLYVIFPFDYDGIHLVAGGLAGIELEFPGNLSLYEISFNANGVVIKPPGLSSPEREFALREFIGFQKPSFDSEIMRFWTRGCDCCVFLSSDRGTLCIYSPISTQECDDVVFFTPKERGGGEQSPEWYAQHQQGTLHT